MTIIKNDSVGGSKAVFQTTTTTYSSSTTTYSSSTQVYGGSDRAQDLGPENDFVFDVKPQNMEILTNDN